MNVKQFRKYRILFFEQSCSHCNKYLEFIERINAKLPTEKRIKLVDCEFSKYGITDPLYDLFEKHIDGFPTLFLDGSKKTGINSVIESLAYLESYLNRQFVVPEYNKFMFDKECYVQQKGKLKGEIICK